MARMMLKPSPSSRVQAKADVVINQHRTVHDACKAEERWDGVRLAFGR